MEDGAQSDRSQGNSEEDREDSEDQREGAEDSIMEVEASTPRTSNSTSRKRKAQQPSFQEQMEKMKKELQAEFSAQRQKDLDERRRLKKEIRKLKENSSRRGDSELDSEPEDEEAAILHDLNYELKDDGQSTVDMKIRHMLVTPNADPGTYWSQKNGGRELRKTVPVRGSSLYLEHLMESRVSSITLRTMHDAGKILQPKHFLSRNSSIEYDDDKKEMGVVATKKGTITNLTAKWEEPETLFELVEAVHNYVAAVHQIRSYSYEAIVVSMVLHRVRFFARPAEEAKAPKKTQMKLVSALFAEVLR